MTEKIGYSTSDFEIDEKKLSKEILRVYNAAIEGRGIFYGGHDSWKRRYLPQWRIPNEFEFNPKRTETRNPKEVAKFLWTSVQLERQAISWYLERKFHQIW